MKSGRITLSRALWLPMLVLAVLVVESSLPEDLIFHPEWGFESFEITIPKKLSFRAQQKSVTGHESYLLKLKGKNHVLHLRPKRFLLPRHLQVFSFTEQGDLLEDHPYIPNVCNYMGSVQESRESEATVSTCMGGLRGILKIDEELYQIEPLKDSPRFEHAVYVLNKEHLNNWTCAFTNTEKAVQMAQNEEITRLREVYDTSMHPKYLELYLLFCHERYLFVKSNVTQVISDAIIVTSIIDTYYQDLDLRVNLQALEIWTDRQKVRPYLKYISAVLVDLLVYRVEVINKRNNADWAHLYLLRTYEDAYGGSWGGSCTRTHSASISSFPSMNILEPGTWTTHEIGHSIIIHHDEDYCYCKGKTSCIMGTGRTGWSNCSFVHYFRAINQGLTCLNNIPETSYRVETCGNGVVEDDEECDCGTREDCEKDPCCQPDCKLTPGATCGFGLCCHNCQLRPSGYVCRQQENECDLAEYCNGTSGLCPDDTYKQDGTPCTYEGLCFGRQCQSRYLQCQRIFGPDAREAPQKCYDAVNLKEDQYGNCGLHRVVIFRKCHEKNTICGRLQCINVRLVPDMPDHSLIINTHLLEENLMCWGTGYHLGMRALGIPDLGTINDGTFCGKNQICFNKSCVDVSILRYDCLPEKCNNRGVCNNKKNCHCMHGWAPPFCEEEGYGGSINSGPPGPLVEEVPATVQVVSLMLLRLIFLFISVFAVFLVGQKHKVEEKEEPNMPEDETFKVTDDTKPML
ncbi:PREDICTED: disintegrin and metalloproteinase domain-containing protein 30-like [Elephantulus edwardii]|uniref:disintegrin and metalloproteinase domain-containing protein 30-like n=1 Tax=Elephantulus edwardii TaxID=28737 RepID=UPI0003F0EC1E|nr:PREDICTED: disintegrin and metalloproteinase domain-containing protein 30-like [Elephantulus edwardii]